MLMLHYHANNAVSMPLQLPTEEGFSIVTPVSAIQMLHLVWQKFGFSLHHLACT